jgi:hypothetical protein
MTVSATLRQLIQLIIEGDSLGVDDATARPSDDHESETEWRAVQREADQARLAGLTSLAVERGLLHLDDDDRGEFIDSCRVHFERAVAIERSLVRAHDVLTSAGVRPIVLKGVAVAHLDYPSSHLRSFSDVDLLVRPDQMDRAIAALLDVGGRRDLPPRTRAWDRTYAKDIPVTDDFGIELDVHRTLDRGPFGFWIDLAELHRTAVTFTLAGRTMHALGPCARVMHAAYALTIAEADPRAGHAVDFVLAARRIASPDDLTDVATRWRAGSILSDAISLAGAMTGHRPTANDGRTLVAPPPHPSEATARTSYRRSGATNASELLAVARALPRSARLAYVRALALPSADYRRARRTAGRPSERRAALDEARRRLSSRNGRNGTAQNRQL